MTTRAERVVSAGMHGATHSHDHAHAAPATSLPPSEDTVLTMTAKAIEMVKEAMAAAPLSRMCRACTNWPPSAT